MIKMLKVYRWIVVALIVSGCTSPLEDASEPFIHKEWQNPLAPNAVALPLKNWYRHFNDDSLTSLVEIALKESPDRHIAKERLREARFLEQAAGSRFFPIINFNGQRDRVNTGINDKRQAFEAGFDASYELDLFGRIENQYRSAEEEKYRLEAEYEYATLTLIAEIGRIYTRIRAADTQLALTKNNVKALKETVEIMSVRHQLGEINQLDLERSLNMLHVAEAQIPEVERGREANRLALSIVTGVTPEDLGDYLKESYDIPKSDNIPLLETPTTVIANRPDVKASKAAFLSAGLNRDALTADLFPTITLGGFYGIAEGAFFDPTEIWSLTAGTAYNVIDFKRIENQIDALKAKERQAFETYRKTILNALAEVETALSDYGIQKKSLLH